MCRCTESTDNAIYVLILQLVTSLLKCHCYYHGMLDSDIHCNIADS